MSNTNNSRQAIPPLTHPNNNGLVSQQQSNKIQPSNGNNKELIREQIQYLLLRQFKACFITTKALSVNNKIIPIGTAGKVVLSRRKSGIYCCVFAVPFDDVEAIVNPVLYLDFGMISHTLYLLTITCFCFIHSINRRKKSKAMYHQNKTTTWYNRF